MQKIYSFDLPKFVKRLTPPRWRTKFNLAWYECLLSGISYSQNRFGTFKDQTLIELSYNGTTLQLERMLNDRFDKLQRRIIIDHEEQSGLYLYNEAEGQTPHYLFNESGESGTGITTTYLYNEGENLAGLTGGVDFIVIAPVSLTGATSQIKAQINIYKLAGVSYTIQYS